MCVGVDGWVWVGVNEWVWVDVKSIKRDQDKELNIKKGMDDRAGEVGRE